MKTIKATWQEVFRLQIAQKESIYFGNKVINNPEITKKLINKIYGSNTKKRHFNFK